MMECPNCGAAVGEPPSDHTELVDELVRQGKITELEAREHEVRSVITLARCPSCGHSWYEHETTTA